MISFRFEGIRIAAGSDRPNVAGLCGHIAGPDSQGGPVHTEPHMTAGVSRTLHLTEYPERRIELEEPADRP
jgi:hypothetical protein